MKKIILGSLLAMSCMFANGMQADKESGDFKDKKERFQNKKENFKNKSFEERKGHILKMMDEKNKKHDKALKCVKNAASQDDLEKCKPEREKHKVGERKMKEMNK